MPNAIVSVPPPRNEPILAYAPGSPERKALRAQLAKMSSDVVEITPRIGGRGVATARGSPPVAIGGRSGAVATALRSDEYGSARGWRQSVRPPPLGGLGQAVSALNIGTLGSSPRRAPVGMTHRGLWKPASWALCA